MYALYDKVRNKGSTRYCFRKKVSLFGCKSGYVPWLLSKQFQQIHQNLYRGMSTLKVVWEMWDKIIRHSLLTLSRKAKNQISHCMRYRTCGVTQPLDGLLFCCTSAACSLTKTEDVLTNRILFVLLRKSMIRFFQ